MCTMWREIMKTRFVLVVVDEGKQVWEYPALRTLVGLGDGRRSHTLTPQSELNGVRSL